MTEFEISFLNALGEISKAIHVHAAAVRFAGEQVSDVGPALKDLSVETGGVGSALSEGLGDLELAVARICEASA